MNPSPKIKICGMRDPENIDGALKLYPDYLGFILYPPSKRFVGLEYTISNSFPEKTKRVGVTVNALLEELMVWVNQLKLDYVQLHGDESPEYCMEVKNMGIPAIKSFGVDPDFNFMDLEKYLPWCDFFLFDTKTPERGGSGRQFDWKILKEYPFRKPFFLSGGIGPDDVQAIKEITGLPLHSIDINSKFEMSPGMKNIEMLQQFINNLKSE